MNDSPQPDDKTLRIGADGELIPEDEEGKPVYLSGAPMIKTDEATIVARVLYAVVIGFILVFLCGIPSILSSRPFVRTTTDFPTPIVMVTRTPSLQITPTPSLIFNPADIPSCTGSYAVSIYAQVEGASSLDRYILRFQVNGTFCNLLLHPIPDEVIRFDADGSGAIFYSLATGNYYHGRFADGHIYAEPYLDPPETTTPRFRSPDETFYLQRSSTLIRFYWLYRDDRATIVLKMPWWVTEIIWAEWVSRPD